MNSLFKAIATSIRYAKAWPRAVDFAAMEEFSQSMSVLEDIYAMVGRGIPSEALPAKVNILLAAVSSRLGRFELSYKALRAAVNQLTSGKGEYNKNERKYLLSYCVGIYRHNQMSLPVEAVQKLDGDSNYNFDIKFVRNIVLTTFPLG